MKKDMQMEVVDICGEGRAVGALGEGVRGRVTPVELFA